MEDNSSVKFTNLNHTVVTRPTEGQLKWALLHHKRVAVKVQQYVERLYMCPESIQDAPTQQFIHRSPIDDVVHVPRSEPSIVRISEGRRTMLYFSNLEYEHRKRYIAVSGYRYHRSTSDDESDQSTNSEESDSPKCPTHMEIIPSSKNTGLPSTGRRKKFRQRRKKFQPRCSDPERVRRFKEAFQVALHSLEMTQDGPLVASSSLWTGHDDDRIPAVSSPNMSHRTKWKRPDTNIHNYEFCYPLSAETQYTVYGCSSVPKRPPSVHNPTLTPGKAPLDRGATWLNLLPASHTKKAAGPPQQQHVTNTTTPVPTTIPQSKDRYNGTEYSHRSIVLSPALRQHVADVAREIFSGERHGTTNSESPIQYNLETLERDITSFVDQFEEHLLLQSDSVDGDDSVVSSPGNRICDVVVEPMSGQRVTEDGSSGTSTTGHRIVPVVTYDSDESKHHHHNNNNNNNNMTAWNESRISKNLDETFTLQELDSSFQCWNVTTMAAGTASPMMMNTTTEGKDENPVDMANIIMYTNFVKNIDGSGAPNSVPDALAVDLDTIPVFDLSPMNWKHVVRRLPDPTEIIHFVSTTSTSNNHVPTSVTDHVLETETNPTTTLETVLSKNVGQDTLLTTSTAENSMVISPTGIVPEPLDSSKTRSFHRMTKHESDGMDRNDDADPIKLRHPSSSYGTYDPTISAGCGLYTERPSHYDVAWERRMRL